MDGRMRKSVQESTSLALPLSSLLNKLGIQKHMDVESDENSERREQTVTTTMMIWVAFSFELKKKTFLSKKRELKNKLSISVLDLLFSRYASKRMILYL